MLTLNLISDNLKKEIKLRHIYVFIKKINLSLIIITITVAIILLSAKTMLQLKFNEIVEQTTLVTKNNESYNSKIKQINNKINFIEKIQKDFMPWSDLLKTMADITPKNINLYYLNVDSTKKTIKIKGLADQREDLLNFKQNLENTAIFKNIDLPVNNILEKENINFEINAKINLPR